MLAFGMRINLGVSTLPFWDAKVSYEKEKVYRVHRVVESVAVPDFRILSVVRVFMSFSGFRKPQGFLH